MFAQSEIPPPPDNPHDWRPQEALPARRRPAQIDDPILEPLWTGTRVIAHFASRGDEAEPYLDLLDENGQEVSELAPRAAQVLRNSVMAGEAIIDGILTEQATGESAGISGVAWPQVSRMGFIMPRKAELTYSVPRGTVPPRGEMAFVALDVLSVDRQQLLDVPLLERKRQLESLFVESELVRFSPYARPPLERWLSSWTSAGFRGVMMKAANSRYHPGYQTLEWTAVGRGQRR
jgi:hypothetical protein